MSLEILHLFLVGMILPLLLLILQELQTLHQEQAPHQVHQEIRQINQTAMANLPPEYEWLKGWEYV